MVSMRVVAIEGTDTVHLVSTDGVLPAQLTGLVGTLTVTVVAWYSAMFNAGLGSGQWAGFKDSLGGGGDGSKFNGNSRVWDDNGFVAFSPARNSSSEQDAPAGRFFSTFAGTALSWGYVSDSGVPTAAGTLTGEGNIVANMAYATGGHHLQQDINRLQRVTRKSRTKQQCPKHYVSYTGAGSGNFIVRVDSDVTFGRTTLDSERTWDRGNTEAEPGDQSAGAKFYDMNYIVITSAVNVTAKFRLPVRDVQIGDEIGFVIGVLPMGGATIIVEFPLYNFSTGTPATTFAAGGYEAAGTVATETVVGGSGKTVFYKFRCLWSGLSPGGEVQAWWVLTEGVVATGPGGLGSYIQSDGATATFTGTIASSGDIYELNQGI